MTNTYTIENKDKSTVETFQSRQELTSECSDWQDIEDELFEIWNSLDSTRGYENWKDPEFVCDYFDQAITSLGYILTKVTTCA